MTAPDNGTPRCGGITRAGLPCQAPAGPSGFCFSHDPSVDEETKLAAYASGRFGSMRTLPKDTPNPIVRSPKQAVELLEQTMGAVRTGQLSVNVGNSVAYMVSVSLRAMEIEIGDKLDRIEKFLSGRQLR